ncbi:MAG: sodium:solute symporter family protein [Candidatus Latescibacteria bacterium]|nr:sodium:solute symporter family protein [Candidatus Latescibacterota bacterium]
MGGIHFLDIVVLFVYLIVIVIIGVISSKSVKNTGDFFIGGRRFGKFMTMMFNFGTGTHSDQAVGVISKCYQVGLAGIWYQWLWLLVNPFYWLIGPVLRRLRIVTTADYFAKRYNKSVAALYALVAMVILMLNIGTMLLGSGRVIEAVSGQNISFAVAVLGMTALFLIYGIAGGLIAAFWTDFLQGILTIILSFILLPFAIAGVGGFTGLHEKLSGGPNDMFSLIAPGEITIFFILITVINAMLGWALQPQAILMAAACRTEMDSRIGVTYGNYIKRFCTVAWAFTGLCCIVLFPSLENPDHAFGVAARHLLPTGLVGLLIASVLASVQSSCDALMVAASGIFTRNVYQAYISKEKSEKHYLFVGRATSFFIVAGSLAFAFYLPGVIAALELFWKLPALMGIPFWIGIFWRRANSTAAWVSFLLAFAAFFVCEMDLFIGYEVSLPWQMVIYITAGLTGAVIAGLVTKPHPKEKLDLFYNDLLKPVDVVESLTSDTMTA